jgi:DNA polymerase-3 subunit beta
MKNAAQDPALFPQIPSYADGGELLLQVDAELLKEIIAEVAFAAADKDASKPALTGVHLEIGDGKATFAAADSFCLAVSTILIPDDQLRQTLLLPAKTMEELARILPIEGSVQILLTEDHHQAVFHSDHMDVAIRLLNETFPNIHNGVIPQEWVTRAVIQTQELAELVRLMAPFARQGKNSIRLKLSGEDPENLDPEREPNTVTLSVEAQDVGENHNVMVAQVEGPDQEIDLHVKYLADVLTVMNTPQIALSVTNKQHPAVIKPIGGDDYTFVLMPVNFGHAQAPSRRMEPASAASA